MPWKSKAQMRYVHMMENKGAIKKGTAAEFDKKTPEPKNLPERIHPKGTFHKLHKLIHNK